MKIADYRKVRSVMPKSDFYTADIPAGSIDLLIDDPDTRVARQNILSAIQLAIRDERGNAYCRFTGAIVLPKFDEWGNNLLVEIHYAEDEKWLATYGVHYDRAAQKYVAQCYAD